MRAWTAFVDDLNGDEWQFYAAKPTWLSPCFFTHGDGALGARGGVAWPVLERTGSLLVLLSSVTHWVDPRRDSWRRSLDIWTVRTGMTGQWLIAIFECARGRLPLAGIGLLMLGIRWLYRAMRSAACSPCDGRTLARACTAASTYFSNAGNLLMLRLVF